MPYTTELYAEKSPGGFYASLVTLLFALTFPLFYGFNDSPLQHDNSKQSGNAINTLLHKAEKNISFSPELAEQLASEALQLSKAQNNSPLLVRALIILGKINNLKAEYSKALGLYSQAVNLAYQNGLAKEQCEAILDIGEIVYKKGDYDKSVVLFLRADSIASKHKLSHLKSYALYYTGKYHHTKGNFPQAKDYYLKSLDMCRKSNDSMQLALLLPSLGKYYISEGKLNLSLSCYQEAYYISQQLHDQLLSADICNHLGGLYVELKEYDKAMLYHRKALNYRLKMNYPGELAKSYNNIGKIYFGIKNLDSAGYYFNESLLLCKKANYKKGLVKALVNLGEVYRVDNLMDKASGLLFEAYSEAQLIGYDNGIAESSLNLGDLFMDKNKPDTAIHYYKTALHKLSKTNYNEYLLRTYHGLYNCYNGKQDYKQALAYHKLILETEKKLLDVENKRQLAILNITFDTERKENDYKVLLKDNELKASLLKSNTTFMWLIVVALGFAILLCLYLYNRFYIKKKANKQLEELNIRITKQNSELEKLNSELEQVSKEKDKLFSIISHELRNPLYWLQNLAEVLSQKYHTMSPEKIRKTVLSLDESAKNVYHLMDNLLHWSRSKLNRVHPRKSCHNLSGLVSETAHLYESFFQQKKITFRNNLAEDIFICADADLFSCVIRNLVSNAIKYTPPGGTINIDYQLGNDHVTLMVSDSGNGIASSDLEALFSRTNTSISMPGLMQEKGSGLGLKLCRDFVEMNEGKIWADSCPGEGTRFYFTVPLYFAKNLKKPIDSEEFLSESV